MSEGAWRTQVREAPFCLFYFLSKSPLSGAPNGKRALHFGTNKGTHCKLPGDSGSKNEQDLAAALESECEVVFFLFGTILSIAGLVQRVKAAGKVALVHADLVEGLGNREIAVDALKALCVPDGIISTRPPLVRRARHLKLITVQRAFILDSMSISSLAGQLSVGKPDFIEVLPGIMPRVITEISERYATPVIAGGLIKYKDDVLAALRAGRGGGVHHMPRRMAHVKCTARRFARQAAQQKRRHTI